MSSEKDFIEYLIFMNKFVVLWEILKYSPDSWENYSLEENKHTKSFVLKDQNGKEITDDEVFDTRVNIHLSNIGLVFYERYLSGEFFKEAEIIRKSLVYDYL